MKVHNLQVTGSLQSGAENIGSISSSVAAVTSVQGTKLTAIETSTGSLNTFTSSATTRLVSIETSTSSLNTFSSSTNTRLNSVEDKTGSYATTGSNTFIGNQIIQGSIIPSANGVYDLGDSTHVFRHLYLSSGSLYIDGTKVLGSTTQELQITTDAGQSFKILEAGSDTITLQSADGNITLAASGGGDVILDPTTGIIALKGTTTVYAGNRILSSDGNAIQFGNSVTMTGSLIVTGYIETQELRTTYISSSILYRSGSTKFGDELTDTHAFTGSLSVSGSISVPGSSLISGSLQVISLLPSGTVSGSSQVLNGTTIHSGSFFNGISVVSGSAQVDVMSTTNIARLATTGSNTFTSNQIISGSITATSTIQSNGGAIQTYNQTSGYGVGFYFPGSTTPSIFADNVLRVYQRVEVWGGTGGYYLDVRDSSGNQNIKFDGNGGNSFLNSGNFNVGYSGDQGAKLYVQANQASYAAYFEQVGGATSSYGGVRITTNSTGVNSLYIDNAGTQIFSVKGSGVAYVQNALGVGYSDPQYTLQVNGNIGLRANSQNIKAITGTGWGYSVSSYKVVMLGDTANNVTVSIGYDPSGNSNSAFSGDGREILFRNGASFATPTSGNTAFHLNTLVMKDGKVAVGTADPAGKFHVYSTTASDVYLETGTSGTSGKLIFKTSDNSDLNKYIGQESYYMVFSGNANEGFKWRDSNSTTLMALFGSNNAYGSRLGINTTTPAYALDVTGNMRINQSVAYLYFTATTTYRYLAYNGADAYWRCDGTHYFEKTSGYKGSWDASGNLSITGNLTESSALKYKENINNIQYGLDTVLKMRPVSYDKKETKTKEIGFIAEELNEIIPEIIKRDNKGEIDAVSYSRITAILVEAIKELNDKINKK